MEKTDNFHFMFFLAHLLAKIQCQQKSDTRVALSESLLTQSHMKKRKGIITIVLQGMIRFLFLKQYFVFNMLFNAHLFSMCFSL